MNTPASLWTSFVCLFLKLVLMSMFLVDKRWGQGEPVPWGWGPRDPSISKEFCVNGLLMMPLHTLLTQFSHVFCDVIPSKRRISPVVWSNCALQPWSTVAGAVVEEQLSLLTFSAVQDWFFFEAPAEQSASKCIWIEPWFRWLFRMPLKISFGLDKKGWRKWEESLTLFLTVRMF